MLQFVPDETLHDLASVLGLGLQPALAVDEVGAGLGDDWVEVGVPGLYLGVQLHGVAAAGLQGGEVLLQAAQLLPRLDVGQAHRVQEAAAVLLDIGVEVH